MLTAQNIEPHTPATATFARGFILSEQRIKPPFVAWIRRKLGKLHLAYDPRVPFTFAMGKGKWVAVLGMVVDVRDAGRTAQDIAARAASLGLDAMLADTDYWAGRFLVIRGDGPTYRICTDASGMRAAFYNLAGPLIVASHASLVGREPADHEPRIRDLLSAPLQSRMTSYYPGRLTPYRDVVQLTASVTLNLSDRSLRRFWPRSDMQTVDIIPAMREQVAALCATGRPVVVSLTAGMDSRLSLAAARDFPVSYFTYAMDGLDSSMDREAATAIAGRLCLDHKVMTFGTASKTDPIVQILRRSCILAHGHAIASAYRRAFSQDTIHIRSNVSEVGRGYYRKRGLDGPVTAQAMAHAWHKAEHDACMVAAFDDWKDAVAFPEDGPIDPWDLFYLEHRMPMWHGNVVLESDIAFDTWSLFNCRAIMEALMMAPREERLEAALYHRLIGQHLPELRDMPINARVRLSKH